MTVPLAAAAFQPRYARYYDALYRDKDYEQECDFLEVVFQHVAEPRPASLLDVGCGTGGHVIPLVKRGYSVVGVDQSEGMITVAREKAQREGLEIAFHVSPLQSFQLGRQFDTVTCLFNVLDYVTSDSGLEAALATIHRHLRSGGLFVFDYRNGVPSLRAYSPTRVKWVHDSSGRRLLRISESTLDPMRQLFHTAYTVFVFDGDRVVDELRDEHVVRFLFPREVERYLTAAGFEVLHTCDFPHWDRAATEDAWNVAVIARKQ